MPWASGSITADLHPKALQAQQQAAAGEDVAALHNKLDQLLAAYAGTPRGSASAPPSTFASPAAGSSSGSNLPTHSTAAVSAAVAAPVSAAAVSAAAPVAAAAGVSPPKDAARAEAADVAAAVPIRKAARSVSFAAPQDDSVLATAAKVADDDTDVGMENAAANGAATSSLSKSSQPLAQGAEKQQAGDKTEQAAASVAPGFSAVGSDPVSAASAGNITAVSAQPLASAPAAAAPKRRSILKTAFGRMLK